MDALTMFSMYITSLSQGGGAHKWYFACFSNENSEFIYFFWYYWKLASQSIFATWSEYRVGHLIKREKEMCTDEGNLVAELLTISWANSLFV